METVTSIKSEKCFFQNLITQSEPFLLNTCTLGSHRCLLGPGTYQGASYVCPEKTDPCMLQKCNAQAPLCQGPSSCNGTKEVDHSWKSNSLWSDWACSRENCKDGAAWQQSSTTDSARMWHSAAMCQNVQAAHIPATRSATGTVVRKSCAHYWAWPLTLASISVTRCRSVN